MQIKILNKLFLAILQTIIINLTNKTKGKR